MDDIERAAVAAEGYDPDDPAVVAALERVRAVLAALGAASMNRSGYLCMMTLCGRHGGSGGRGVDAAT